MILQFEIDDFAKMLFANPKDSEDQRPKRPNFHTQEVMGRVPVEGDKVRLYHEGGNCYNTYLVTEVEFTYPIHLPKIDTDGKIIVYVRPDGFE